MKIDFSIWGIRRGFEPAGFLHNHSYPDVLALQKDRYRNLSNSIGGQGFYLLQRPGSHLICTYVDTGVYEFVPNGSPRPGFVAFSLIIKDNFAFASSPRRVLEQLSAFYRERVGETQYNNFVEEDILRFLSGLEVVACYHPRTDMAPAYAFYENAGEIDDLLTGKLPYALHTNLALIPGQKDQTGIFKPNPYAESIFDASPKILDLVSARLRSEQEREREKLERERIANENKNKDIWKAEAVQQDPEIDALIRQNKLAEAREKVNQCRQEIRPYLQSLRRLEEKEKELEEAERVKIIAKQISELADSNDLAAAHHLWKHNHRVDPYLTANVRQAIRDHEQKQKDKESAQREKARKDAARKKNLKISLMGILVAAVLGTAGYFGYQWYIQEPDTKTGEKPPGTFKVDSTGGKTLPKDSVDTKDSSAGKAPANPAKATPTELSGNAAKLRKDILGGGVIEIPYHPNSVFENIAAWKKGKIFFKLNTAKDGYLWADQKNNDKKFEAVEKSANDALNKYLGLDFGNSSKSNISNQIKDTGAKNIPQKSKKQIHNKPSNSSTIEKETNYK